MNAIRVTVVSTRGSAPREAGAAMLVTEDGIAGTIGGGALEWQAMAQARAMLKAGAGPVERTVSLGPGLGQCCGGAVTLRFEPAEGLERPQGAALWIWGAGHVGRALVRTLVAPCRRSRSRGSTPGRTGSPPTSPRPSRACRRRSAAPDAARAAGRASPDPDLFP
jgi:xanthine/CO dehydrogenase XdhC/CoxF family maturation factor